MKYLLLTIALVSCLEQKALYFIGAREEGRNNRGEHIEDLQSKCGLHKGSAYCACYIYVCHVECGVTDLPANPNLAASWARPDKVVWRRGDISSDAIQPGMVALLHDGERIFHAGMILYKSEDSGGEYIIYHSGNTRSTNIIGGEGIHLVKLYLRQIYAIADWITPSGNSPAKYHVVKYQENLYRLGIKYKTTPAELRRLNGLREDEPIFIGQHLRVQ